MKADKKHEMPTKYEYLNGPLYRAQEHIFLINAELDNLHDNSLYDDKIVKLQHEKRAIIGITKQEFEKQTWEDGPSMSQQVEDIIDHQFSDKVYDEKKGDLIKEDKTYNTSRYWEDKMQRNIEYFKRHELEMKEIDRIEKGASTNARRLEDWHYEVYGQGFIIPPNGYLDEIEPDKE